jgi:predicted DNA-binding transcriptional regulator AlpA
MEYITATEAQRRYFVTVKTLGKWIKEGTLPAHKVIKNKLAQWEIEVEDLERVLADKHTSSPTSTLQVLEERVSDLEHRVTELTDALHTLQATHEQEKTIAPTEHPIHAPRPARQKAATESSTLWTQEHIDASSQPEGTISLQQLADELGMHRSTLYGHVKNKNLQHIAIPKVNRPTESERFFTDEQAQAVRLALNK